MEEPKIPEELQEKRNKVVALRAEAMAARVKTPDASTAGKGWQENKHLVEAAAAKAEELERRAAVPSEPSAAHPEKEVVARPQDNMIQLDELEMSKIELLASKRHAISLEEQLLAVRMRELRQNKEKLLISEAVLLKQIGAKFGFEDVQAIRLVDQARGLCVVDGKKDVPTQES